MFTSVCKTTLLCFSFLMLGLCHRSMASCVITSQASGTIIKETFPSSCYASSNHHSVRVKCAPKPRVSLFPSLSAATSSSSSRKRNLRSVVRVVGAASATSEAENVQAEEGVLEQVGESRGGNIKADPLRIILFQVTKPYFCWEIIRYSCFCQQFRVCCKCLSYTSCDCWLNPLDHLLADY